MIIYFKLQGKLYASIYSSGQKFLVILEVCIFCSVRYDIPLKWFCFFYSVMSWLTRQTCINIFQKTRLQWIVGDAWLMIS
jgi:hypothetical protein